MSETRNLWERYAKLTGSTAYRTAPPSGARTDVTGADLALALACGVNQDGSRDELAISLAYAKAGMTTLPLRRAAHATVVRLWMDMRHDRRLGPMLQRDTLRRLRTVTVDVFGELLTGRQPEFSASAKIARMRRDNYRALYDAAHAVVSGLADQAAENGLKAMGAAA